MRLCPPHAPALRRPPAAVAPLRATAGSPASPAPSCQSASSSSTGWSTPSAVAACASAAPSARGLGEPRVSLGGAPGLAKGKRDQSGIDSRSELRGVEPTPSPTSNVPCSEGLPRRRLAPGMNRSANKRDPASHTDNPNGPPDWPCDSVRRHGGRGADSTRIQHAWSVSAQWLVAQQMGDSLRIDALAGKADRAALPPRWAQFTDAHPRASAMRRACAGSRSIHWL